jgi:hypothetical protein
VHLTSQSETVLLEQELDELEDLELELLDPEVADIEYEGMLFGPIVNVGHSGRGGGNGGGYMPGRVAGRQNVSLGGLRGMGLLTKSPQKQSAANRTEENAVKQNQNTSVVMIRASSCVNDSVACNARNRSSKSFH